MPVSIAHLGPAGTYAEMAALAYIDQHLADQNLAGQHLPAAAALLCPYANIAQTIHAVANGSSDLGVVPVENSIEGSVTVTLDTIWQLEGLTIHEAIILPISHGLVTRATDLTKVQVVYSHPQALAQCQLWLAEFLPQAQLIPTPSTTDALQYPAQDLTAAAIASPRAAKRYNLPVLRDAIQDYADNCTRFLVLSPGPTQGPPSANHTHTALAFSLAANAPGALLEPLKIFAERQLNLSRIESRPSKRALGDYVFFVELEVQQRPQVIQEALAALAAHTDVLKILGHYRVWQVEPARIPV
jgi:prephenate dehydratase